MRRFVDVLGAIGLVVAFMFVAAASLALPFLIMAAVLRLVWG